MNETEGKLVLLKKQSADVIERKQLLQRMIDEHKSSLQKHEQQKLELEVLKSKMLYLEQSKRKSEEISKQKENLQKDINFLAQHTDSLKAEILNFSKFDTLFRSKQDELKKAFMDEKNTEIILAELKKELELAHKEIGLLQQVIVQKELQEKKLKEIANISSWLSNQFLSVIDFTEIQVMLKLRREFSRVFSSWFHMIAGEAFEVQLDENFTPVIMQGEVEMDYAFLSGGERTAVALAYRLALNQTINSVLSEIKTKDIVILDEPTDGFSEAQIDKIRDVLEELKVRQLIIVSHEQKIESFVDTVIRLKKTGDVSMAEDKAEAEMLANQKP